MDYDKLVTDSWVYVKVDSIYNPSDTIISRLLLEIQKEGMEERMEKREGFRVEFYEDYKTRDIPHWEEIDQIELKLKKYALIDILLNTDSEIWGLPNGLIFYVPMDFYHEMIEILSDTLAPSSEESNPSGVHEIKDANFKEFTDVNPISIIFTKEVSFGEFIDLNPLANVFPIVSPVLDNIGKNYQYNSFINYSDKFPEIVKHATHLIKDLDLYMPKKLEGNSDNFKATGFSSIEELDILLRDKNFNGITPGKDLFTKFMTVYTRLVQVIIEDPYNLFFIYKEYPKIKELTAILDLLSDTCDSRVIRECINGLKESQEEMQRLYDIRYKFFVNKNIN